MVKSYYPCELIDVPERIHGKVLRFDVCTQSGELNSYYAPCYSIAQLIRSVERRLSWDVSLASVCVFLPSGRLLFHYFNFI